MRKDVDFKTQDGVTLKAWHYLPDRRSGKVPTIVMAHGFSAVKEMYLDRFAEVFAAAGLGILSDGRTPVELDRASQLDRQLPGRSLDRNSHRDAARRQVRDVLAQRHRLRVVVRRGMGYAVEQAINSE